MPCKVIAKNSSKNIKERVFPLSKNSRVKMGKRTVPRIRMACAAIIITLTCILAIVGPVSSTSDNDGDYDLDFEFGEKIVQEKPSRNSKKDQGKVSSTGFQNIELLAIGEGCFNIIGLKKLLN